MFRGGVVNRYFAGGGASHTSLCRAALPGVLHCRCVQFDEAAAAGLGSVRAESGGQRAWPTIATNL